MKRLQPQAARLQKATLEKHLDRERTGFLLLTAAPVL
jgi:hypothetical protein